MTGYIRIGWFEWYINQGDNKTYIADSNYIIESTQGYSSHKFIKTDVNNDGYADFIAFGVDERIQGDYKLLCLSFYISIFIEINANTVDLKSYIPICVYCLCRYRHTSTIARPIAMPMLDDLFGVFYEVFSRR